MFCGEFALIICGFKVVGISAEQFHIIDGNNFGMMQEIIASGATGWYSVRGSDYDCDYCDSMAYIVHPITEMFEAYHPRCMCYPVPVYNEN